MDKSIEKNIQRIKRIGLSCTLNNNGHVRHFHCGHEYVEIGGLKWATMNVGAEKPTDSGLYFAWGDTQGYTASQVGSGEGKKYFGWADYKFNPSGDAETFTKYNDTDGLTTLESLDDAATFNMGVGWRIPTRDEFKILVDSTTSKWITNYKNSGVSGRLFTDKTDSSKMLFFPAAGNCANGNVRGIGDYGKYWSGSLGSSSVSDARRLNFNSGFVYWGSSSSRSYGYSVRGVVG